MSHIEKFQEKKKIHNLQETIRRFNFSSEDSNLLVLIKCRPIFQMALPWCFVLINANSWLNM